MGDGSESCPDSKQRSNDKEKSVFDVESVLLHYTRAVGTYNQYLGARKADITNVVDQAFQFWRTDTDWEGILAELNSKWHGDVPRTYPWW